MSSRATGAPRSLHLLCAIALLLAAPARSSAQSVGAEAGTLRPAITSAPDTEVGQLNLLVGRSAIVNIGQPIARVSLTRPEVADAMVTGSQQLLVHGKMPGTISMFIWDRSGGIKRYDVTVARDLSQLTEQLRQLFPGESIAVTGNGKDVVVSGTVSSKYVIEKAVDVAAGYVDKKEDVVNLLRQQEGVASNQVLLRVRFAEVSRSALTELGGSFFTSALGYKNYTARTTTQQFAAPTFDTSADNAPKLVFSDYLNFFLFNNKEGLGGVIRALQNKGLFESLAEPNLVAENGKEASFLAGGEYPYPVVQGTGANLAVTIVFKEYGIRLSFLPTLVGGDLIHLKVRPEVSSLDFTNAITYQGFRIPSLSTRRAETEIELMDGQTFAIAGLIDNTVTSTMQKIPGIGDIPILGLLFRSKAMQKAQSELVVMITPQILRRGSMGAAPGLPNLIEPYMPAPGKTLPQLAPRLPGGAPRQDQTTTAAAPPIVAQGFSPANAGAPAEVPGSSAASAPSPIAAQGFSPATPATVVAQPTALPAPPVRAETVTPAAQPVTAPSPAVAPVSSAAATAPASVAVATPPPAPKIDEKKLAEERKAAAKAAERKREEDRKAEERAAKALKQKQEAEGRELARQREIDAKRRETEATAAAAAAKTAEERRKAEAAQAASIAEAQRQAEAKLADEQRKAEIRKAEEQVKAERARLEVARTQADEARKLEEKAAKERAKRDAAAAKQSAGLERKQVDAEKKRLKEIQDAVDRLNAAQAAYQAAVEKVKKGGQS